MAFELVLIEGLDVSAMVLIEVRELVVQQDRRVQRIRDIELHMTSVRRVFVIRAIAILHIRHVLAPCRRIACRRRVLKRR